MVTAVGVVGVVVVGCDALLCERSHCKRVFIIRYTIPEPISVRCLCVVVVRYQYTQTHSGNRYWTRFRSCIHSKTLSRTLHSQRVVLLHFFLASDKNSAPVCLLAWLLLHSYSGRPRLKLVCSDANIQVRTGFCQFRFSTHPDEQIKFEAFQFIENPSSGIQFFIIEVWLTAHRVIKVQFAVMHYREQRI